MSLNLPKDLYGVTACMAKPQEAQQGWKRCPRRGATIRTRMVYKGSSSVVPNL